MRVLGVIAGLVLLGQQQVTEARRVECDVGSVVMELEGNKHREFFTCELTENGVPVTREIKGLTKEVAGRNWGLLKSGRGKITIPNAVVSDREITIPEVAAINIAKSNGRGRRLGGERRELAKRTGVNTILVVRGNGLNGAQQIDRSAAALADDIFGINSDVVNLKSQMAKCSGGALTFTPATGPGITNGVVDVVIPDDFTGQESQTMMNALRSQLSAMGINDASYDHAMYVLPPGTAGGGWIAYAWINSLRSVYNNGVWGASPSGGMHELGHNLGLAHASEGGTEYADQTGYMGYSYSSDEGPQMCYNPNKFYHMGWYTSLEKKIDPINAGGWSGKLIGVNDAASATVGVHVLVLQIVDPSNDFDLFLTYNRQEGMNSQTKEKGNQVTIVSGPDVRGAYGNSDLLGGLSAGQTFTRANFGNTGVDLTITVDSVGLDANNVDFAMVTVSYSSCSSNADCVAPDACSTSTCSSGTCIVQAIPGCVLCSSVSTCNAQSPCTSNTCSAGKCQFGAAIPNCCTSNSQCNDQDPCTNDQCSNNQCVSTPKCNDGNSCTADLCDASGTCSFPLLAGCSSCNKNGVCEPGLGETCSSCSDCVISVQGGYTVGNGICEIGDGEDCFNSPADCAGVTGGPKGNRFCCGQDLTCASPECSSGVYQCKSTSTPPQQQCCGATEICGNGIDDDCNGVVDDGCVSEPPTCQILGGTCADNTECCSGTCDNSGNPRGRTYKCI